MSWLNNPNYSPNYYLVLSKLIDFTNLSVYEINVIFSLLTLLVFFILFKGYKSKIGLLYFLIIFNFLTIFFILSPGRTSLTYLLIILVSYTYYNKQYLFLLFFSYLLYLIHFETLIMINITFFILMMIDWLNKKLNKKLIVIMYFLLLLIIYKLNIMFKLEINLYIQTFVGIGQSNTMIFILQGLLILFVFLINKTYSYFLGIILLIGILTNMNEMYLYRTIFCSLLIVVLYKDFILKRLNNEKFFFIR